MTTTGTAAAPPAGRPRPARAQLVPWLATLGRIVLGVVFVAAGASKVTDLANSVRSVRAYRLLPEWAAPAVGAGLPFFEIALGVLLIVGLGVRVGAIVGAALLVIFIAGIASAAARGLRIDCGCFGNGGDLKAGQQTQYLGELARDAGLLVVAALLAWRPRGRVSIDNWIHGEGTA
ncbi:MAG: hypothetical protein QOJ50_2020 [Cryptosporangiaceae bacterium]|nr:hypothetical protein [Cryptosporangiaceae bacterium]